MSALSLPRRFVATLSAVLVGALLGGVLTAYAGGTPTGNVDSPPKTAFLARSDNPADALGAGPIAGRLGAPMFITPSNSLDAHARQGLIDYGPELVILAGGTAALSAGVAAEVAAAVPGATIRRVAGANRMETARLMAELMNEYNPAYLPIDLLPDVVLAAQGAVAMTSGSYYCITAPYTPDVDRIAVAQIGLSGRKAAAGTSTLYARFGLSTNDGANWTMVSNRISPENHINDTEDGHGAISFTDVVSLKAGTTYLFAVRAFGGLAAGRCNMVITATPGSIAQTIPNVPQPTADDAAPVADNTNGG